MINEKIRFLRDKKKLRHEDMAERLEISTSAYSRLENGETKINVERLKKIAEILEVPVEDLLNSEPVVFHVENNSGGPHAYGLYHPHAEQHGVSQEFLQELIAQHRAEMKELQDRYDARHEAHVQELKEMNKRLVELLE